MKEKYCESFALKTNAEKKAEEYKKKGFKVRIKKLTGIADTESDINIRWYRYDVFCGVKRKRYEKEKYF